MKHFGGDEPYMNSVYWLTHVKMSLLHFLIKENSPELSNLCASLKEVDVDGGQPRGRRYEESPTGTHSVDVLTYSFCCPSYVCEAASPRRTSLIFL